MSRLPRDSRTRAVVLVVTVVIVVAASTVGLGALRSLGPTETPEYEIDALVPDRVPATGEPAIDRRDEPGVVLVDVGHANRMTVDQIRPLLSTITAAGYEVDLLEGTDDLDRSLSRADAFVVIDPGLSYSDDQAVRVERFVERGGRLLLIGEPSQAVIGGFGVRVQDSKLAPLASRFGFEFGEAYLYNMETNDGNHLNVFAEPAGASVVTSDLSRTAFYTATTVQAREGRPVLVAGPGTRSSRTDANGTYPVAAVNGNVLAVADGTFLQAANFRVADNEQLLTNVVRFLLSGNKRQALATYPSFVGEDPRIHYTGPALLPAAQLIATDLRATGRSPRLTFAGQTVGPNRTDVLVTTFGFLADRGGLGTGISATESRVRVTGYASDATGIIVVRAPATGYDVVIAADTPGRAEQAASMLAQGNLRDDLLDRRTAVVRTEDAVRVIVVEDG